MTKKRNQKAIEKPSTTTTWFIKPRDAATNEALINELLPVCGATTEKVYRGVLDKHGKRHDLIEVPYESVSLLQRNLTTFGLEFEIYLRHEGEEFVRIWKLNQGGSLSHTVAVREMRAKLKKRTRG